MLVILAGVAGAGKDTIARALIKRMENLVSIPSFTSRAPRADDIEGVTYNFVSKKEFERMIADGELYEYDIHHENYYGTSRKVLNEKIQSGKIIIKDIDVNGTEALVNLLKQDTKVVTIFLRVPKEELEKRLNNRIDHLSPKEIKLRLNRFDYEESKIGLFDYVIKNDDLEKTLSIIQTIIEREYKLYKNSL